MDINFGGTSQLAATCPLLAFTRRLSTIKVYKRFPLPPLFFYVLFSGLMVPLSSELHFFLVDLHSPPFNLPKSQRLTTERTCPLFLLPQKSLIFVKVHDLSLIKDKSWTASRLPYTRFTRGAINPELLIFLSYLL